MKKIYVYLILFLIVIFAGFLRLYKLDQVPPSLNWDEVAAGYNAYTIANWGKDEWGHTFPLVFTSFRDDKHPVHIYITSVFVKAFGLNDFVTRFPSALVGTFSVLVVFFLAKKFFKDNLVIGLLASLFLTISTYHLQFSRGLWESNFALFFYMLGLALFYYGVDALSDKSWKKWLIPLSIFSFGLSFFSYHSSKILVPPTIILLLILEYKKLILNKKTLALSGVVLGLFVLLTIKDPRILGLARVNQTKFSLDLIKETKVYKNTNNPTLGYVNLIFNNYVQYFNPTYLFIKGDQSPRNSVKVFGQFYKFEAILLIFSFVALVKYRSRKTLVLLLWILLSPIAAALSSTDLNANRAIFMAGSFNILFAAGAGVIIEYFRVKWVKLALTIIILSALSIEFYQYLNYYYNHYAQDNAIEWQYGMKQTVNYISNRKGVDEVFVDKIRQQPYIFLLFYLKTPLPQLLKTVVYDNSESQSYNTILSFGKYQFGGWNPIESVPNQRVLYVLTPSYYSWLRYINEFSVDKLIKYPNGSDAFYIVEGDR